jgi:hypothetical protein
LAKKKWDEGLKLINVTKVERVHMHFTKSISIGITTKMLHLLVEINNHLVKGLVDIGASMFIMLAEIILA